MASGKRPTLASPEGSLSSLGIPWSQASEESVTAWSLSFATSVPSASLPFCQVPCMLARRVLTYHVPVSVCPQVSNLWGFLGGQQAAGPLV